jgi:hypothetical protein
VSFRITSLYFLMRKALSRPQRESLPLSIARKDTHTFG